MMIGEFEFGDLFLGLEGLKGLPFTDPERHRNEVLIGTRQRI